MQFLKAALGSNNQAPRARSWNKAAVNTLERLREVPADRLQRQLIDVSTLLDACFDYASHVEACDAMECFLNAWNHILACVEDWSTLLRGLCLDVVAKIASRDEFCITHIRLDKDGDCPSNPRRFELLCCYASCLRTTQAWAGDHMSLWQPVPDFCARILALSVFRLPEIHSLVCSTLSGLQPVSMKAHPIPKTPEQPAPPEPDPTLPAPCLLLPPPGSCCGHYRQTDAGFQSLHELDAKHEECDEAISAVQEVIQATHEEEAAIAAAKALERAEAAQAQALLSPKRSTGSRGFLQLWYHVAGEGRGKKDTEWLQLCLESDGSVRSSNFFCSFLANVAVQCNKLINKGFSIPGVDAIEAAAVLRLMENDPKQYSAVLIEACSGWLRQQPTSLDRFLEASLSQMSVHNAGTVVEAVRFMTMWISAASVKASPAAPPKLPDSVKLDFTIQALEVLLTSQTFQVVLRTLVFLYDHLNLFSFDARAKLVSGLLLEKLFFGLFLHWLSEVRLFFCNLLVYKVFRTSRFDVFRELQEMAHLSRLQLSVPSHLGHAKANDSTDEDKMQDFCFMAKFAFYLGAPCQHLESPGTDLQIGEVAMDKRRLVYSDAAIRQLKGCIEESYEWKVNEAPQMGTRGMATPR
eukprot:TRINITY_DN18989_c0_g2_i1.p1 TRINITY_DN18989_c0_g2~~TRINITY_DN18989_c0_g2_i1.p1  ORF type:complete len:636 (+),score=126.32 TRINITY_DN18989_c0_g2_i1:164-2071(+)